MLERKNLHTNIQLSFINTVFDRKSSVVPDQEFYEYKQWVGTFAAAGFYFWLKLLTVDVKYKNPPFMINKSKQILEFI